MERIRVDVNARQWLGWEDGDFGSTRSRILDATYVPLFERYRRSNVPSVRYTAEFETALLTGQPNIQLWTETLAKNEGPFVIMARRVIREHAMSQLQTDGRQLQGDARNQLVGAAVQPQPVNAALMPRQLPRPENVRQVQAGSRFATVEIALDGHGYTMLFERRGERWIYLFLVSGWIA